jgi:hypothetical protein
VTWGVTGDGRDIMWQVWVHSKVSKSVQLTRYE